MDEDVSRDDVPLSSMKDSAESDDLKDAGQKSLGQRLCESFCSCIPKRYLIAALVLLGFCNVYSLRVNLSVALVAMVDNHTRINENGEQIQVKPDFDWSTKLQGLVLGAFFYGYIITQLPGGFLSLKFGAKSLFGFGIFCTSFFTLLTPVCAQGHVALLIAVRVLEGLCEGVVFPANHAFWSKWAPTYERSKLVTITISGAYIGTVVSMPLSGVLAERYGWESIFYSFGAVGIIWCIIYWLVVFETPETDPCISPKEAEYIVSERHVVRQRQGNTQVPWGSILTSGPVWAIVVAHTSENWGFYTLLTCLPTFLKEVLKFDIAKSGFIAALPYLVMAVVIQLSGWIADTLRERKICSTTKVRKAFTFLGFSAQTIFMLVTGYTDRRDVAVVGLTLAVGLGGFAWSGFGVNHIDIAPQYSGILMGLSNTFATIPGMISPIIVGFITSHQSKEEWRAVFYIAAAIYLIGMCVYIWLGSGERQPWAEEYEHVPSGDDGPDNDDQNLVEKNK